MFFFSGQSRLKQHTNQTRHRDENWHTGCQSLHCEAPAILGCNQVQQLTSINITNLQCHACHTVSRGDNGIKREPSHWFDLPRQNHVTFQWQTVEICWAMFNAEFATSFLEQFPPIHPIDHYISSHELHDEIYNHLHIFTMIYPLIIVYNSRV